MIKRDYYLNKLISKKENGQIKIITGIRRCGKSYLLFNIYSDYLMSIGVEKEQIISLALDEALTARYRDPFKLDEYIRSQIKRTDKMYYVFLDEIQNVVTIKNPFVKNAIDNVGFVDVLLGLMKISNVDIYVTGSNSKMLSSDIVTEFRGRGDEIKVHPLTFKELSDAHSGDKNNLFLEYATYGGLPFVLSLKSYDDKSKYLKELFNSVHLIDVIERNNIINDTDVLGELINVISSSIGSLTNPAKLSKAFDSHKKIKISANTISKYLSYFEDAFIISRVYRYDIKGKKYIETPLKYYFEDIGLRNARLNFRQYEENHIMENIIYNELIARGYNVDVGVIEQYYKDQTGTTQRKYLEVDFVVNKGADKYYIQSAFSIDDERKREQELDSLKRIPDSFKKIVIIRNDILPWKNEDGILFIGIERFLLDSELINQ